MEPSKQHDGSFALFVPTGEAKASVWQRQQGLAAYPFASAVSPAASRPPWLLVPSPQLAWCAVADIGHVAAAVIAGGPGKYAGQVVPVVGDVLRLEDVAEVFSKVFGCQVGWRRQGAGMMH